MNIQAEIEICPQCGGELERGEDPIGVTYQCQSMDCLALYDADEIEGEQVTTNFKQPKAPADKAYMGYVKQLPCVICEAYGEPYGQAPSDAHHPTHGRNSQARMPDHTAIPLCKAHHQTGEHGKPSWHGHREAFIAAYGPDIDYIDATRDRVKRVFDYTPKGFKQ